MYNKNVNYLAGIKCKLCPGMNKLGVKSNYLIDEAAKQQNCFI
jgi:hypothetical protein